MRSIRLFLIAGILAVIMLTSFIAALHGYQSSMAQADTLFDNQLLDLARLVESLDLDELDEDFRLGNNMSFQIWQDDQLLGASSHAPSSVITPLTAGFDFANFDGYRWRTYTRQSLPEGRWIIVAERTDLRFVLAENVVLDSIIPILLSVPLIGLLIWGVITLGLRPLQGLSEELRSKTVTDLTPLKAPYSRLELEQVINSINGFIFRLQSTLDREKRFSADAAHELRTPISALKIQLHNLKTELGNDSEAMLELENGVDRMQHLVEQLLSLYRMTAEQFAENTQSVDLYHLAEDVLARNYNLFEEKQQQVELIGTSQFIQGDRFTLETLLSNLLNNAAKYTPAGGEIRVEVKQTEQVVRLLVEDNGPGISEENRARVFERFFREQDNKDDSIPGCGLGLTIVSHVAALHGASISFQKSSFGHGFAIAVDFPAAGFQV
jgi:two-component system sensor histidine kinase QseC